MSHLTLELREIIEESLKDNLNFTSIGILTNTHRTTISAEVKNRRIPGSTNLYGTNYIFCHFEETCTKFEGIRCKRKCSKYMLRKCPLLEKPPYVCNGCSKKNGCRYQKYYYRAKEAQNDYEDLLKSSREGIRLTQNEIDNINRVIVPLIKYQGHSINQVYINYPDILYFSKTEFYRLIDLGYINLKNIDLRRKVTYKQRKQEKPRRTREESLVRVNRTYVDFQKFVENNPNCEVVQMDTVEGIKGGKVMLTLLFENYNFMLIYLLEKQTKNEVIKKIDYIKETLKEERFAKLFKVILTDNGKEFYGAEEIESSLKANKKIINLFYCDPSASYQKGAIEKNHEYIRYILPKGSSFDDLTQEDCNVIMSHINSTPRKSLKNKTPYQSILSLLTKKELLDLGVREINHDEVNLTKKVIKR